MKGFTNFWRLLAADFLFWRVAVWVNRAARHFNRAAEYRDRGRAALEHAHRLCARSDALADKVMPPCPDDIGSAG